VDYTDQRGSLYRVIKLILLPMTFSTFIVFFILLVTVTIVARKVIAVFLAPYFVCKLPERLGIIDLTLNPEKSSSFCVYCASNDSLYGFFNIFPWESRGILSLENNEIHYVGSKYKTSILHKLLLYPLGLSKKKCSHIRYSFNKQKVKVTYIPPNFWRDGGLTWMRMESDETPLYFTTGRSRLGILDFNRESDATTGLYKLMSEV
jgi:hypothetical protein